MFAFGRVVPIAIKLSRYELISTLNIQPEKDWIKSLEHGCDGAQPSSNTSFCHMVLGCYPWILDISRLAGLLDIRFKNP